MYQIIAATLCLMMVACSGDALLPNLPAEPVTATPEVWDLVSNLPNYGGTAGCDDSAPQKKQTGVSNFVLYVEPSAHEDLALIEKAVASWETCGFVTIAIIDQTRPSGAKGDYLIDINKVSTLPGDDLGLTTWGKISDPTIMIDYIQPSGDSSLLGVIQHEIGHALGEQHWGWNQLPYPGLGTMCAQTGRNYYPIVLNDCQRLHYDITGGSDTKCVQELPCSL